VARPVLDAPADSGSQDIIDFSLGRLSAAPTPQPLSLSDCPVHFDHVGLPFAPPAAVAPPPPPGAQHVAPRAAIVRPCVAHGPGAPKRRWHVADALPGPRGLDAPATTLLANAQLEVRRSREDLFRRSAGAATPVPLPFGRSFAPVAALATPERLGASQSGGVWADSLVVQRDRPQRRPLSQLPRAAECYGESVAVGASQCSAATSPRSLDVSLVVHRPVYLSPDVSDDWSPPAPRDRSFGSSVLVATGASYVSAWSADRPASPSDPEHAARAPPPAHQPAASVGSGSCESADRGDRSASCHSDRVGVAALDSPAPPPERRRTVAWICGAEPTGDSALPPTAHSLPLPAQVTAMCAAQAGFFPATFAVAATASPT
jgi:hypothetical protein